MPIIDVTYTSLEDTVTGDTKIIQATEVYHVTFDGADHPGVRKMMAWYGTGWQGAVVIPPTQSQHRFDQFLFVTGKDVEIDGGVFNYKVTVTYESIGDPLTLTPIITYGGVGVNEQVDTTQFDSEEGDEPIVNSSDELFDPPTTVEIYDAVVTIVRNEQNYNAFLMDTFRNSINRNTWQVFAPETVLLQQVSTIRKELQIGFFYYEVTYVLYIRFDGWRRAIIDQGFRTVKLDSGGNPERDANGAKQYIELVDSEGKAMTQPTFLKDGQKLPDNTDVVKLLFLLNRRTDFDALGLPTI